MPDPLSICVVVSGEGYIVNVRNPTKWVSIALSPVMHICRTPDNSMVVFGGLVELVAYDESGVQWISKRVSIDSMQNLRCGSGIVTGEYQDMDDAIKTFSVELGSGKVIGGVENCNENE